MRLGQIDLLNLDMPLVLRPGARLSDEDLMRFSEQNKPYKIERNSEGDLTIMTPVGGIGGTHEKYVAGEFYIWTAQDGRGIDFSSNTGFNLPDGSCLSPDAAWLSLERWNALTLKQQTGFPPLCPDFLIEIRSQSDSRRLFETTMQLWLDNGAKLAWLVDPIEGDVTIYRPGAPSQTLVKPDLVQATSPVEGFALRTTRLWTAA